MFNNNNHSNNSSESTRRTNGCFFIYDIKYGNCNYLVDNDRVSKNNNLTFDHVEFVEFELSKSSRTTIGNSENVHDFTPTRFTSLTERMPRDIILRLSGVERSPYLNEIIGLASNTSKNLHLLANLDNIFSLYKDWSKLSNINSVKALYVITTKWNLSQSIEKLKELKKQLPNIPIGIAFDGDDINIDKLSYMQEICEIADMYTHVQWKDIKCSQPIVVVQYGNSLENDFPYLFFRFEYIYDNQVISEFKNSFNIK